MKKSIARSRKSTRTMLCLAAVVAAVTVASISIASAITTPPLEKEDIISSYNVSYELEEIEPLRGTLGYRVIATGELINEDEYEQLMREYLDGVAVQEGVGYYDMFLREEEPAENMKNKRVDLIAKHSDGIPAELTTLSNSKTYNVNLAFNGSTISDEKYENFHFVIDNSGGDWAVFQGLSWLVPYPEFPVAD